MGKEETGASETTDRGLPKLINSDKPKFFGLWNELVTKVTEFMNSTGTTEELTSRVTELEGDVDALRDRQRQYSVDIANLQNDVTKLKRGNTFICRNTLSTSDLQTVCNVDDLQGNILVTLSVSIPSNQIVYTKTRKYLSGDLLPTEFQSCDEYCTYRFDVLDGTTNRIQLRTNPLSTKGDAQYVYCKIENIINL